MGYYVSHMFGIRTGGVFGGATDMADLRARVSRIATEMKDTEDATNIYAPDPHCISQELEAHKGAYVVIAGVFNYWMPERAQKFAARLSQEFGTEVMHMAWDEERNDVRCQIFLDGKPLFDVSENPIGQILRRVT